MMIHPEMAEQALRAINDDGRERPYISVVTPVYRSQESLVPLYKRLRDTMEAHFKGSFELIMVNDASPDEAWPIIKSLVDQDPRVTGINLSRNFGQYYALSAGLDRARGEWIVIMDCDLQDQPEEIANLHKKAEEGFDVVLAQRINRQDNFLKKFFSKAFYQVFSYLTDTAQDASTAQFGIYHRKVISTVMSMRERLKFFPAFIQWVGFKSTAVPVSHGRREHGKSSYSFRRLMRLAVDTIIGFSDKPLRLVIQFGFMFTGLSFLTGLLLIIHTLVNGPGNVEGWASIIVSICFFSGLIISLLGVNGIYIAKIYEEVKKRPLYVISDIYEQAVS